MSNSHTKFGWISFNGKGEDSIGNCYDARKYLEIFLFSKSLTCLPFASECVCWFNLDVLFIYPKENCIIWHLLASISAFINCTSSTGIPAFSNKYTHQLTLHWLKGDILEFIGFITLKWSIAGISSSHNITSQINQGALI